MSLYFWVESHGRVPSVIPCLSYEGSTDDSDGALDILTLSDQETKQVQRYLLQNLPLVVVDPTVNVVENKPHLQEVTEPIFQNHVAQILHLTTDKWRAKHVLTRFPKDANCEMRKRTKITVSNEEKESRDDQLVCYHCQRHVHTMNSEHPM